MKLFGHSIKFTALLIAMGVLSFVLYAKTGITAPNQSNHEIRMAVDPTVLPPIPLPAEDDLPIDSMLTPAPAEPEIELPETEKQTPLPKPPAKANKEETPPATPMAEMKPEPKVETPAQPKPKTTPKPTPQAEQKPTVTSSPAPVHTGQPAVTKVTIDSTNKKFVMTVYCNRPVGDTTYMNLSNPKRLVVDLREPWELKARNVLRVNKGAIKHVVAGAHPDRLRLVIHFRTPFKGNLSPKFVRTGNKLIVSAVLP